MRRAPTGGAWLCRAELPNPPGTPAWSVDTHAGWPPRQFAARSRGRLGAFLLDVLIGRGRATSLTPAPAAPTIRRSWQTLGIRGPLGRSTPAWR